MKFSKVFIMLPDCQTALKVGIYLCFCCHTLLCIIPGLLLRKGVCSFWIWQESINMFIACLYLCNFPYVSSTYSYTAVSHMLKYTSYTSTVAVCTIVHKFLTEWIYRRMELRRGWEERRRWGEIKGEVIKEGKNARGMSGERVSRPRTNRGETMSGERFERSYERCLNTCLCVLMCVSVQEGVCMHLTCPWECASVHVCVCDAGQLRC